MLPKIRLSLARFIATIAIAFSHGACGDEAEADLIGEPSPENLQVFFSDAAVWSVDLELDYEAIQALYKNPRAYVSGSVRIGNHRLSNVGVRLKGTYSFRDLTGKSSFKIKFDEFVPEQNFLGLERLTLNAMNQDRAQLHEWFAYRIFSAAGVPAPRSGFVWTRVNEQDYGLYANVETIDDEFLEEHFADDSGNLYEAPWTADLIPEKLEKYTQDEGTDLSRSDLNALMQVAQQNDDEIFFGAKNLLDTTEFLTFVASEAAVGHWDGYRKPNNYFLYHEPTQDQWSFLPWGADQTFDREVPAFSGKGFLIEKCLASEACRIEYAAAGLAVVDMLDALDIPSKIAKVEALVEASLTEDPRRTFPLEMVRRHRRAFADFVKTTPERLRLEFDCVDDTSEADRDGDGFGACLADCNDESAEAKPGGVEICDGLDNDCNGYVDDLTSCPCAAEKIGDQDFLFCENAATWSKAISHCSALGGVLATPIDAAQSMMLFEKSQSYRENDWYLGTTDGLEEGSWLMPNNQTPPQLLWAEGEPDDWGGEDCAVLSRFAPGEWIDVPCSQVLPFICRMSAP